MLYIYIQREKPRLPQQNERPMANVSVEKRLFPRIDIHAPIRYQMRGRQHYSSSISKNLSAQGISFLSDRFIAPETTVMLDLNVLSTTLEPIGRVRWSTQLPHSDRYQVGVQFVEMNARQKNFLGDYIDMHTGKL